MNGRYRVGFYLPVRRSLLLHPHPLPPRYRHHRRHSNPRTGNSSRLRIGCKPKEERREPGRGVCGSMIRPESWPGFELLAGPGPGPGRAVGVVVGTRSR